MTTAEPDSFTISAAVSFGIGDIVKHGFMASSSAVAKTAFQMGAHGLSGGIISVADGGDFGSGFASGAVSSLISSGVELISDASNTMSFYGKSGWSPDTYTAITIAAGGLSGGLSSTIAGGSFWRGARQGLITSGVNHVVHKMSNPVKRSFRQQLRAKGIKPRGRFGYTRNEHNNIIGAVEELNDLHSNVSSKIEEIVYYEGGFVNERGQEGSAAAQMQQNGKYSLHVSQTRVVTNLDYAYNVGHELYHIFDNGNMTYTQWMNRTERQLYESEIRTYKNFDLMNNIPGAMNRIIYYQQLINNLPK